MTGLTDAQAALLEVTDWELDISAAGKPVLIVTPRAGAAVTLELPPEQLPELAAGLIRLAEHLRNAPPCGTVRRD